MRPPPKSRGKLELPEVAAGLEVASMRPPPKSRGKPVLELRMMIVGQSFNEAPAEKQGKTSRAISFRSMTMCASMRPPPKSRGKLARERHDHGVFVRLQ